MARNFGMGFFWGWILIQGFLGGLTFAPIRTSLSLVEIRSTPWCKCDSYTRMTANDANESTQRLVKDGMSMGSQTCARLVNSPFCITCSLENNALSVAHYVIKVILHILPPQGFRPEREIPRRHPSSSRVNIEVLTVQNIPSICQKKSRLPWSGAAWNR